MNVAYNKDCMEAMRAMQDKHFDLASGQIIEEATEMMTLEKVRERLEDAIKNGTAADVHYWRGYLDATEQALKARPNEPLTLEELKQMYCQTVWVQYEDGSHGTWGIVELDTITLPAGAYCIISKENFGQGWKAYRRPPKEDTV